MKHQIFLPEKVQPVAQGQGMCGGDGEGSCWPGASTKMLPSCFLSSYLKQFSNENQNVGSGKLVILLAGNSLILFMLSRKAAFYFQIFNMLCLMSASSCAGAI